MAFNQPAIFQTSRGGGGGGLLFLVAVFLGALGLSIYLSRLYAPAPPWCR